VRLAVGATPTSAVRAGTLGLPMALAIIGGQPERFKPFVELFRRSAEDAGNAGLPVSINSHAYVADTSERAADEFFPGYATMMNRIGRERGWSGITRADFDALRNPRGALLVGSPEQVVDKILFEHELFGNDRFLAQLSVGAMPHAQIMHAIELFGSQVAPAVRQALAASTTPAPVYATADAGGS
jgi:alkanesulfonate monooxygenase SsuD/methylene tetrahydromethanopterin reductase-like flavin-dependent oxidoreductase (luciferase family)